MLLSKLDHSVDADATMGARIVHDAVPGRVRLRHASLLGRDEQRLRIEKALRRIPGVASVKTNGLTGTALIAFHPPATAESLALALDAAASETETGSSKTLPDADACHAEAVDALAARLGTQLAVGLSAKEAAARISKWGRNELRPAEPRSAVAIFAEQMTSLPIALLAISAGLSLATGGIADAVMIAAVVLVNASIATATEREADRTILGMTAEKPPPTTVIRDGVRQSIDCAALTVGDILVIERSAFVPADARLIESDDLGVNEAPLTGEAHPATKDALALLPAESLVSDRRNMVFRGTVVTGGSGAAIVTAVGARTEIGRVQELLGAVRPPETPIQRELGEVGRELVIINGVICAIVFGLGLYRGHPFVQTLRSAISLAVAAIPEGLPAVATTTLAIGVQDMRKRKVLVRKIDAVETLGAVEIIGLDKTGTLTENRMAVGAIHLDGAMLELQEGRLLRNGEETDGALWQMARRLFEVATLCSDAVAFRTGKGVTIDGTPTETALLSAGVALGLDPVDLRLSARALASAARGEGRKRMSTLHETPDGARQLCVKGDPVEVLARCARQRRSDGVVPLDEAARAAALRANERMASDALRVLGVAYCEDGGDPRDERDLVWLGLAGIANPIRASVRPALKQLHRAGVRTVMITGDQSATAFAIARNLDLNDGDELRVLEAGQIANMPPELLEALAAQPDVFARVSPVDKLNIVKALQVGGRIVAMTGDGVNDGPALRAADVGIAMGGEGADVARQVADIVLATDDMDGIVEAIKLGRATYANIRKVLRYLVSTNASETIAMLGAALVDARAPLTPMQLLWLNLATDALPALALGLEPPEAEVLDEPPHDPGAPIMGANDFRRVLREGAVIGTAALLGYYSAGGSKENARASTITFHGLTFAQLLHAIACRSETRGLTAEIGRRPNPLLYGGVGMSLLFQCAAQFLPPTRRLLRLAPLGPGDLLRIGAIALGSSLANDFLGYLVERGAARRTGRQEEESHVV
ncbi:cation-transporting P-type ATPase [Methylocystis sp. MJC1]|jgi:Ca2+-transporting ATPase|uniref:cation-translocating P-type ATPase n=1 Tax=Methylocystis sp. MJC1 TaxID=2654282 RepID=UPI0013E9F691|nr:HAD-IC family P-type ATPase [Methylocystis sp. MJC1]KAF2992187.1 Calcium-transporting ATPase 1 [Methylocystis sp. MJC1]MBU6527328.1 cation-transporting P-type ATPase [Methylocystis sp. MJC1]UZX10279.1 cation-transporting P-type ATPase [Methylocystis sp. MJC1]